MKPLYVKKNGVVYKISGNGMPALYPAENVEYNNAVTSELQATDVQGAIDELSTRQGGVQSDWNENDNTELDYIKNKPQNLVQDANYVHTDNNYDATAKNKVDSLGTASAKDVGVANGVAELDAAGKVPSSQLPSFVDDVIEVADYDHLPITGESGKIYVTLDTNKTYRWTGSGYAEISESLALGETSSTAYRGDRGKTAYSHATETKLSTATASGLYKVAATAQGHISSLTLVQKSDITALGIPAQDTTYGVVSKTANGLAPQLPNETTTTKYLRQDGTWQVPPDNDTKNTAGSTDTSSKIFLIGATSQAANPQTYSDDQVFAQNGLLQSNTSKAITYAVNSTTGITGGISLYNNDNYIDKYGLMFRTTASKGKHGDTTGNYSMYFTMDDDNSTKRGWIFQKYNSGNVASINTDGNAVFNGSVTIGGNATNTSGARMEYNSSTQAIDFVFN